MSADIVDNQPAPAPKRRDGNAHHYDYRSDSPHYIEQTVSVYLRLADDGRRWIVDSSSVDGCGLDSAHGDLSAHNDECACGRPQECESVRVAADRLPLPTGAELLAMLAAALDTPEELISPEQANSWAGRDLTPDEVDRLAEAIPHSSIPEAIATITSSWD